jgi:UDP-3-O-[3-hydroxymyristoyl] glucosamine N-acyltransferase
MADVPTAVDVVGSPAQPVREFFRQVAVLRRLVREATGRRSRGKAAGTATNTD